MIGQYVRNLSDDSRLSRLAVDMIKYADQFDEKKTVGQKTEAVCCLQYVVRFRSHTVKQRVQMSHSFDDRSLFHYQSSVKTCKINISFL